VCNKFEVSGLLYLSGELGEGEARGYEAHLGACGECALEVESYRRERAAFYGPEILGESPSAAVDSEILRVCAGARGARPITFLSMAFVRKYAPVPLFLMLIMVAVGGYVRYHSMHAGIVRGRVVESAPTAEALASSAPERAAAEEENALAPADSAAGGGSIAPRPLGDMSMEGVMTVKGGGERAK